MAKHAHSDPTFTGNRLPSTVFIFKTRDNGTSYYRWSAPRQNRPAQHDANGYYPDRDRNQPTDNLDSIYVGWDAAAGF